VVEHTLFRWLSVVETTRTSYLAEMSVKGYTYILKCADHSYYTGSTKYLEPRLKQHQEGNGAIYTRNRLPVQLVYFEEHSRIDLAFAREKQIQGWSRKKKEALIDGMPEKLRELAKCMNDTAFDFEK